VSTAHAAVIGSPATRNDLLFGKRVGKRHRKAETLSFNICWKSIVSKLVGEDSLTGFLFVYAPFGAIW
jgi:hypothetical protein